jgi:Papain family cysteine protease
MKKRLQYLLILLSIASTTFAQTGWIENEQDYEKILKKNLQATFGTKLPSSVDLSKYAPSVINQDKSGVCVGMSTAYYMRTILEAISQNITDKDEIDKIAYSPTYLYNLIKKPDDPDCKKGAEIKKAFDVLKVKGVASYTQQGFPNCSNDLSLNISSSSKIIEYIRLFSLTDGSENLDLITKKALSENTPVVVGFTLTESIGQLSSNGFWKNLWRKIMAFFGVKVFEDIGLWNPQGSRNLSGHAVCVVGYDDAKFGGAFKVINSWGKNWGEEGYFWIRYTDYKKQVQNAFQAFLQVKKDKSQIVSAADVSFIFSAKGIDNSNVKFILDDVESSNSADSINKQGNLKSYLLLDPQTSGTTYRFSAFIDSTTDYTYFYIINANSNVLEETEKIYPFDASESAILSRNTRLILPPEDRPHFQLTPPTGIEYVLFLFSDKPLNDMDDYIDKIRNNKGSFAARVTQAFGNELVPSSQIDYKTNKMGFEAKGGKTGAIVPILVSFKHVGRRF